MGSKTFDGVLFSAYTDDHPPPHVHGSYAGVVVVVVFKDGTIELADRKTKVKPRNAKKSDVDHIVNTARKHADELLKLWRVARG